MLKNLLVIAFKGMAAWRREGAGFAHLWYNSGL